MGKTLRVGTLLVGVVLFGNLCLAQECSTEKVNSDCTLTIDRLYPVTSPTIQMRRGRRVTVVVVNPAPFEVLTLDPQSTQAVAGTDQIAGFISSAVPNIKMFVGSVELKGFAEMKIAGLSKEPADSPQVLKVKDDLAALKKTLQRASYEITGLVENATTVYMQLQEILSPLPRPHQQHSDAPVRASQVVKQDTPNPWTDYAAWRKLLLCELVGGYCEPSYLSFRNLLNDAATLQTELQSLIATNQTGAPPPPAPLFNKDDFDKAADAVEQEIAALPQGERDDFAIELSRLRNWKAKLIAAAPSYIVAIPALTHDLGVYLVNIDQAAGTAPTTVPQVLGDIYDPKSSKGACSTSLLGCQVSSSINTVNQIATFIASVPPPTQKKSIVTITVLYADPIFEASAGALFSTLANRSFANQTKVTQNPGAPPTPGDIVITQSISRPTVVPFVAANFRLGNNFTWKGGRRGAFYFTTAVGLNTNTSSADFGVGPSISWRSVMFSPMLHFGRDLRLTQGEFVGEVWCNVTAAHDNVPKCSGNPPSPSSERFWKTAFSLGVSIRIPSVFGGH